MEATKNSGTEKVSPSKNLLQDFKYFYFLF